MASRTVELLLQRGANIEAKNEHGRTALILAVEDDRQDMVTLLLENKAMIEARDRIGKTALSIACLPANVDMVRFLLQKGADIEAKDAWGQSLLSLACSMVEAGKMLGRAPRRYRVEVPARTNPAVLHLAGGGRD